MTAMLAGSTTFHAPGQEPRSPSARSASALSGVAGAAAEGSVRAHELVSAYLRALATADAQLAVGLFADGGIVHSPLYGPVPATEFYPRLFADTSASHLSLRSVPTGTDVHGRPTVAFHFSFDWRLASGVAAPFEVVDVAALDHDGFIQRLDIVHDTVDVRPVFAAETGRQSWRQSRRRDS